MKRLFLYPLSILFYLCFGGFLFLFHPLQWVALRGFGYFAHKKTLDLLNFFILKCLNLLCTRIIFKHRVSLPKSPSVIFVANHQSTFDIPPLIWHLRKYHVKFVSKKELGKGIPSVSFNLRHGGSVLIDRKKPREALQRIEAFGKNLTKNHHSVIIFPEGTRSKAGEMKRFRRSGLLALLKTMPDADIVPISIINSWKFALHNYFPMPLGNQLIFKFHPAIHGNRDQLDLLIDQVEQTIKEGLKD